MRAYDEHDPTFTPDDLAPWLGATPTARLSATVPDNIVTLLDHGTLDEITDYVINRRLEIAQSKRHAAVSLGIGTTTLFRKIAPRSGAYAVGSSAGR
jgi:hypothetical protein